MKDAFMQGFQDEMEKIAIKGKPLGRRLRERAPEILKHYKSKGYAPGEPEKALAVTRKGHAEMLREWRKYKGRKGAAKMLEETRLSLK